MSAFEVGQRVIVIENIGRSRRHEAIVTKIGRKWAAVKGDYFGEWQVDKETGFLKPEGGYGSSGRAYTPEALAAKEERDAAVAELRRLTLPISWTNALSTEQARRIVAILREGEK